MSLEWCHLSSQHVINNNICRLKRGAGWALSSHMFFSLSFFLFFFCRDMSAAHSLACVHYLSPLLARSPGQKEGGWWRRYPTHLELDRPSPGSSPVPVPEVDWGFVSAWDSALKLLLVSFKRRWKEWRNTTLGRIITLWSVWLSTAFQHIFWSPCTTNHATNDQF